ncbi:hypothetical protein NL676_015934 [Syzygium grande]|nr:hypothetical protein NL676_015934 [Syzygium grande]
MSSIQLFLILLLVVYLEPMQSMLYEPLKNGDTICASETGVVDLISPGAPIPVQGFEVTDESPGNSRFKTEIGLTYALQRLELASDFVLKIFYQKPAEGRGYMGVSLVVESFTAYGIGSYPDAVASTTGDNIYINSDYIQSYDGAVRPEFTGILYHESTHVWQWNGNGMAPSSLINGIADYVRLKAGWPSKYWPKRGSGTRWDDGFAVTAYFLEYCDSIRAGFVADLNDLMKDHYTDAFFVQLLGKTVDELWDDYKSSYLTLAKAVKYELIDNSTSPGNTKFETDIGAGYAIMILQLASEYVMKTLNLGIGKAKPYEKVTLIVESFVNIGIGSYPFAVASTTDNNIRLNSNYIEYYTGDVRAEYNGILYHESTRVWQWNGNGMAPSGLITGIADYVRLKAGWPSQSWPERGSGSGSRWDEGYAVTAYFLEYCDNLREGFVTDLNAMMKDYYSNDFFVQLLRKNVYELWSEYRSAYKGDAAEPGPTASPPAPSF